MVVCLERLADLHMAQLMALPLTVSCFSKIQIGFTFLVPAHPGSPGKRAVKWVCVCCMGQSHCSQCSHCGQGHMQDGITLIHVGSLACLPQLLFTVFGFVFCDYVARMASRRIGRQNAHSPHARRTTYCTDIC